MDVEGGTVSEVATHTDEQLCDIVYAASEGCHDAFAILWRDRSGHKVALYHTRNVIDGDDDRLDAVSEAKVANLAGLGRTRVREWLPWTFTVSRNAVYSFCRTEYRKHVHRQAPLPVRETGEFAVSEDGYEQIELEVLARMIIDTVANRKLVPNPAQAEAFLLVLRDGLTYDQAAELLGRSKSTVHAWVEKVQRIVQAVMHDDTLPGEPA